MTIADPIYVGDYNVDNAICLLGPADFGPMAPQGCIDRLVLIIKNIAAVILKILNLIFGDHVWYSNSVGRHIVETYFNNSEGSPQLDQKIRQLYDNLCLRANGDVSYAEGINIESAKARQRHYTELRVQEERRNEEEQAQERLYTDYSTGETGNLSMLQVAKRLEQNGNFENKEQIRAVLPDMENYTRNYSHEFAGDIEGINNLSERERHVKYNECYKNLCDAVGHRKYQADPADPETPIESEKNPRYASAKDPYALFRAALLDAMNELGYNANLLQHPLFFRSNDMKQACRLAIYNLLLQADVCVDACAGPYVKFNDNLTASYQAPNVAYIRDQNYMDPVAKFNRDLFSSTEVGCDPEGAKRLLEQLRASDALDMYRDLLLGNTTEAQDDIISTIDELINTMAEQVQERYGKKLVPMLIDDLNGVAPPAPPALKEDNALVDFGEYIQGAKTPYQLIFMSMTHAAQKYADSGLLRDEDLYGGEAFELLRRIISRTAAYEMLQIARTPHDFRIQLNDEVQLECGKYYAYKPTLEHPEKVSAHLQYVPNELSGVGSMHDLASDPVKASTLIKKLYSSETSILAEYLFAADLERLYALKGVTDAASQQLVEKSRRAMEALAPDRRRLIQDIDAELSNVALILREKYFVLMCPELLNVLEIPENAHPNVISLAKPVRTEKLITQDVQMKFVHGPSRSDIVIKDRPVREVGTSVKLTGRDLQSGVYSAVEQQNDVLRNPAQCGNCMFGALSIEIFGDRAYNDIEYYCNVLRRAAAEYMRAHEDQFLLSMVDDYNRYSSNTENRQETEEAAMQRMRPQLRQRLLAHCDNIQNTLEWGGGRELEAIAGVFGVPIHVIYLNAPVRIGSEAEGIEHGVLQPNSIAGGRYSGAPIRMQYSGAHYRPIRLYT